MAELAVKILTPSLDPALLAKLGKRAGWGHGGWNSFAQEATLAGLTESVSTLLTHWVGLADWQRDREAFPDEETRAVPTGIVLQAVGTAQRAADAALRARSAVVHEEPSISREVVQSFATQWLGLPPTMNTVNAVGNALIQFDFDGTDPNDNNAMLIDLRAETARQARAWKPITETQLCHTRIVSLEDPLPGTALPDIVTATFGDTLAAQPVAFLSGHRRYEDPRTLRILSLLHDKERQVAEAYAHFAELGIKGTWEAAAIRCGQHPDFGERVRTKLKRLGQQHASRQHNLAGLARAV